MQEKFNLLGIDELNVLNEYATDRVKQDCNNNIDMWRENGLVKGYFGNRCNNIYNRKRVTNNAILELYIYYCYEAFEEEVREYEEKICRDVANFYYRQGQYEALKEPKDMTDTMFYALLDTPCVNGYTLYEYKGSKALNSTYQTHRKAVSDIQQGRKPKVDDKELEKQMNERLKIGAKISGVVDMILIGINNMSKVEGIKEATKDLPQEEKKDIQVRFRAVRDDRTTKMCESLDMQLFNVNEENVFKRYSESHGGIVTMRCKGLVTGVNLPPINDNFHFCRSTIQYNLEIPDEAWYDKYVEMKTGN